MRTIPASIKSLSNPMAIGGIGSVGWIISFGGRRFMRETLPGQGLRDGSSVRRGRIRLGKIAAVGMGGDPAVTALIDARGKLIKAQIGEKLRSGMAAPQGSRRKWDREFESGLLQQRVCELSVPERRTGRSPSRSADVGCRSSSTTPAFLIVGHAS